MLDKGFVDSILYARLDHKLSKSLADSLIEFYFTCIYEGIELLGISAGEVANPQEAIVKSVKSVLFRILIFYVGAIFVIVTIYPWDKFVCFNFMENVP